MDLTAKAEAGEIDPIIGRDAEIKSCMEILLMKRNGNPVLIGDPGVGKTVIVEGLAQRVVEGAVPQGLQNCKLISLDIGALNSGTKNRGDLENRLKDVLGEVTESNGHTIIFIDEIHMIVEAGNPNGTMDVSNLQKPELDRGKLRCIGATTIAEFRKHIEKDPALKSIILVDRATARLKMDEKECFSLAIDTYKASKNSLNDIEIKLSSMQDGLTVQLGLEKSLVTHIQDINEVIQQEENELHDYQNSTGNYMLRGEITSNDIAEILSKQTGIPVTKLLQSEKEKLLKLEEELHEQIIGQDSAVKSVAMAIKRS
ncbi:hypothetical protein QJS10_CPA05g01811 [Acorus calamus]|uniref:AAA+ ATPase domain-containing protein n=1 Tax=Acorus calamus TaxID=4465 RepID=A0AAV9ETK7_ACOCL|nr:hypothetical protein QJS10_CPA05g01811 [Acorus calamus]